MKNGSLGIFVSASPLPAINYNLQPKLLLGKNIKVQQLKNHEFKF